MAATDARPVPRKNVAFRYLFAIRDNTGAFVTGWTGADSEISKDQGAFADCTNEATEIGSSGHGYIDLTSTEMNADGVMLKITVTNANAIPISVVLYPEEAGDYRIGGNVTLNSLTINNVSTGPAVSIISTDDVGLMVQGDVAGARFEGIGADGVGLQAWGAGTGAGAQISAGGGAAIGLQIEGGTTSGPGLSISSTSGDAAQITAGGGNGDGLQITGQGSGAGLNLTGGATGIGAHIKAGATFGRGVYVQGSGSSPAMELLGGDGSDETLLIIGQNTDAVRLVAGLYIQSGNLDIQGGVRITQTLNPTDPGLIIQGGSTSGAAVQISTTTGDAVTITSGGGNGDAIQLTPHGTGFGINGTLSAINQPKRNTALSNIPVLMIDSTDHVTPKTGLTGFTITRSIDGGAFASATGSIAEVGNGVYQFDASAADMNGTAICFRFSATGADVQFITILTRD